MAIITITGPVEPPVSLEEAKGHLRVTHSRDDVKITSLVIGVTEFIQNWLNLRLVTQTLKVTFDAFPCGRELTLPVGPVSQIVDVKYYDSAGTLQTFTEYVDSLTRMPPAVFLDPGAAVWPVTQMFRPDVVQVNLIAGYGFAYYVPTPLKMGILSLVAHFYENRQDIAATPIDFKQIPKTSEYLFLPYRNLFL